MAGSFLVHWLLGSYLSVEHLLVVLHNGYFSVALYSSSFYYFLVLACTTAVSPGSFFSLIIDEFDSGESSCQFVATVYTVLSPMDNYTTSRLIILCSSMYNILCFYSQTRCTCKGVCPTNYSILLKNGTIRYIPAVHVMSRLLTQSLLTNQAFPSCCLP